MDTSHDDVASDETVSGNELGDDRTEPELGEPRRDFMSNVLAAVIGAAVGVIPAITATLFLLHPLIRRSKAGQDGDDGFVKLSTTVDSLPQDGTPVLDTVLVDKADAWNRFLDQPVGSVYLRLITGGSDEGPQVIAFNSRCPHLGCAVEYRDHSEEFYCPCHTSAFDLDGNKKNDIPPRGLDDLEIDTRGNEIWVRFQNFRATTTEKIPV